MFDFAPGEAHDLAIETARRFAADELGAHQRDAEQARALPPDRLARADAVGFDRIDWPEDAGGAGLGALGRVLVLEALAGGDPGGTLALTRLGSCAHALLAFGGLAALERFGLPVADSAGARAVLVVDPDDGLRAADGRLSGTVPWVPADRVDLLAVLGRAGLALVREGITATPVPGSGLRAAGAAQLVLDGAPVLACWHDAHAAAQALAHARLHVAALMVGQMDTAADTSRRYALDRVAFGKPIAHHQALAFLIVDMRAAVDGARLMVREAAWRIDRGLPAVSAAAAAFAEAIDAAAFVGPNAVQILGGPGFMRDYPVEKHMRELRALGLLAGGLDAARDDMWVDDAWAGTASLGVDPAGAGAAGARVAGARACPDHPITLLASGG
jgi:alkylation response protein AidB-like acyl-CoA dehydrogenase